VVPMDSVRTTRKVREVQRCQLKEQELTIHTGREPEHRLELGLAQMHKPDPEFVRVGRKELRESRRQVRPGRKKREQEQAHKQTIEVGNLECRMVAEVDRAQDCRTAEALVRNWAADRPALHRVREERDERDCRVHRMVRRIAEEVAHTKIVEGTTAGQGRQAVVGIPK